MPSFKEYVIGFLVEIHSSVFLTTSLEIICFNCDKGHDVHPSVRVSNRLLNNVSDHPRFFTKKLFDFSELEALVVVHGKC